MPHWRWQAQRERRSRRTVKQHLHGGGIIRHVLQIFSIKHRCEQLNDILGVLRTHAADDKRTRVTHNSGTNLVRQLRHKLVRHGQAKAILARLRQNRFKRVGGKVLELIHEQAEVAALRLRNVSARHGRGLKLHHKHHTKELSWHLAQLTLRQVDEQNLAFVHHLTEVHCRVYLSQNVTHHRVFKVCPLRDHPRSHLTGVVRALGVRPFLCPEVDSTLVLEVLNLWLSEIRVNQHLRDIHKRAAFRVGHQEQCSIAHNICHARPHNTLVLRVVQ